ncbi:reverse transcriptase domain-containing protein [Candidatus Tisiphia endosymbiont of Sialis lutaria]|uniref:reverse transcriptase domain-containing protein n=1 Tax=Candidatus Tisiphia endosymbiont of Sialis lutaria TaxID=2029164 RepID=UPI00312C7A10
MSASTTLVGSTSHSRMQGRYELLWLPSRKIYKRCYQTMLVSIANEKFGKLRSRRRYKELFDEISHDWIMENILIDKTILQKWLKTGYIERNKLYPTNKGTPQGSIISPIIANLKLDGMERLLEQSFSIHKRVNGKKYNPKINFIRYADDWVITGDTKELL